MHMSKRTESYRDTIQRIVRHAWYFKLQLNTIELNKSLNNGRYLLFGVSFKTAYSSNNWKYYPKLFKKKKNSFKIDLL